MQSYVCCWRSHKAPCSILASNRVCIPREFFNSKKRRIHSSHAVKQEGEVLSSSTIIPDASPYWSERTARPDRQAKDVVLGDLAATLEAHRKSNRERESQQAQVRLDPLNATQAGGVEHAGTEQKSKQIRKITNPRQAVPVKLRAALERIKTNSLKNRPKSADPALHKYGSYIPCKPRVGSVFQPWKFSTEEGSHLDRHERLHKEIVRFSDYVSLTPWETAVRQDLIERIVAEQKAHGAADVEFETFGSHVTGLATPASDVDIGFYLPTLQKQFGERGPSPFNKQAQQRIKRKLEHFCRNTLQSNDFDGHEIVHARYPLLRMRHRESQVAIQIVSSRAQTTTVEYVKNYLSEFPNLKAIYMVVKALLAARGLDEPRTGGLGSYPLLVMIVASFKLAPSPRKDDLARALLCFLKFYSNLNTQRKCICLEPAEVLDKKDSYMVESAKLRTAMAEDWSLYWLHQLRVVDERQPWLLCVQDPADVTNDLCKGAYRILDIKTTFQHLTAHVDRWLIFGDDRILNVGTEFWSRGGTDLPSVLDRFFGNSIYETALARKNLSRWGTKADVPNPEGATHIRTVTGGAYSKRERLFFHTRGLKEEPLPVQNENSSARQGTTAEINQTSSTEDESSSAEDDNLSAENEISSAVDETSPFVDETPSTRDEIVSAGDETSPTANKTQSTRDDTVAAGDGTSSAGEDTSSVWISTDANPDGNLPARSEGALVDTSSIQKESDTTPRYNTQER